VCVLHPLASNPSSLSTQRSPSPSPTPTTNSRLAMVELGRALAAHAHAAAADAVPAATQQQVLEAEGMVMYQLLKVQREAARVFRLRDASSHYSEWPHIQVDLLQLAQPGPAAAKLDLHRAMLRNYALLQA